MLRKGHGGLYKAPTKAERMGEASCHLSTILDLYEPKRRPKRIWSDDIRQFTGLGLTEASRRTEGRMKWKTGGCPNGLFKGCGHDDDDDDDDEPKRRWYIETEDVMYIVFYSGIAGTVAFLNKLYSFYASVA